MAFLNVLTRLKTEEEPYGPLVSDIVNAILTCGLLVDEDYEVLLRTGEFKLYPIKRPTLPLGLIGGTIATIGSIFLARKYNFVYVLLPTLALDLGLLYTQRRTVSKKRHREEIVGNVIKTFRKLQKVHFNVIRYISTRKKMESRKSNVLLIDSNNISDFQSFYVNENVLFFKFLLDSLKALSEFDEGLSNDFQCIKDLDVELVLRTNDSSIAETLTLAKKLYDIYTFLSSKMLGYVAVSMCQLMRRAENHKIENMLDNTLPKLLNVVNKVYECSNIKFNNLRYNTTQKTEIHDKYKGVVSRHVTGTLEKTLSGTINNLSLVTQQSRCLLEKIEQQEDPKKIIWALQDLRDHSYATYESLDILCRLYGILSEATENRSALETSAEVSVTKCKNELDEIRFDDVSEPIEENYELFIPENEVVSNDSSASQCENSGTYVGLMLNELRHALYQHERFIVARKKRGVIDEDEEDVRRESPPKFDLKGVNSRIQSAQLTTTLGDVSETSSPTLSPSCVHPPPPPLLPPLNLENLNLNDSAQWKPLFECIHDLSRQVPGTEEVFGDPDDSCDSD